MAFIFFLRGIAVAVDGSLNFTVTVKCYDYAWFSSYLGISGTSPVKMCWKSLKIGVTEMGSFPIYNTNS